MSLGGLTNGISSSTTGSHWNGTAWVSNTSNQHQASNPIPPPSTELPQIPENLKGTININIASVEQLTTFYSEVYAYWDAQVNACKTSGDTSSTSYQWSVYYADLSSRAAHHYNGLKNDPKYKTRNLVQPPSGTGPPPAFKQYAHKCLEQCVTATQRSSMKSMVEMTIRKALQDGTMHTKNWNIEPLIPLYQSSSSSLSYSAATMANNNVNISATTGKSNHNLVSHSFSNQDSKATAQQDGNYYGPSATTTSSNKKRKWDEAPVTSSSKSQKLPDNDSYYGHGSSVPTSPVKSTKKEKKKSAKLDLDGDFISLSSLSTDQYTKGKGKLVKLTSTTSSKKKKKSNEGFDASKSKLASRANRFSGQGGIQTATSIALHSNYSQGIDRYMGKTVIGTGSKTKLSEEDYEKMTVKGTCQKLEKEFLRLTAPPKAELVRPQPVLEKHLENIIKLRKKITDAKLRGKKVKDMKEYNWVCSQMKAIRQDLTVQRIFNSFSVKVYETHARIALEENDLNEYNQSQTQLKDLYEILLHSKDKDDAVEGLKNQNEFIAYRIIYHVFLTLNKKYQGGSSDLLKILLNLSSDQRSNPFISYALKVRVAVTDNDYHAFFQLRNECQNHGIYLMNKMITQMRSIGLKCMIKSYRPSLNKDFILSELGFDKNQYKKEGRQWLSGCRCVLSKDGNFVMTKETVLDESFLAGNQTSSLI